MIDLTEMTEPVNRSFEERNICLIASAASDGMPDIAFKGSMMVYDNDHLAFWERAHGQTLRNLTENPHACVLYRNVERGQMWRFFGVAELYHDGPLREQIMRRTVQAELDRDPEGGGVAVLIRVDKVLGRGTSQEREGPGEG